MHANVYISVFEGDRLAHYHEGHNVWVTNGRSYLAKMISLSSYDPDVPFDDRRMKHIGFGIGGNKQALLGVINAPPISTAYPAGSDPNATTGNSYDAGFPENPPVSTLERPVRITGGTTPYPGAPGDVWLTRPPPFGFVTITPGPGQVMFRSLVDTTIGELVYPPFTLIPISEVGLFLNGAEVNDPFNDGHLVSYHSFGTIAVTTGMKIEISWVVGFG